MTGTYDGDTGAFAASYSGGVHFVGHRTNAGTYQLDLTISRPTVRISGSTGTLYVDVTSKAKGTGTVTTSSQVPFASLSLGGIDMRGGGTAVVLNTLPATLTAQGAKSFAGYYTAGTALDPVTLSADVRAAATTKPTSSPTSSATKPPAEKETSGGKLVDGAVDWGVRRTFREYVTGDIAKGEWTLSSGAEDGGALFRFPDGEGTFEDGDLRASFRGTVRFTGKKLPLVTFTTKGLASKDGLARVTEAPAKLTADGAKAFGGMYRAGTEMDPVSVAVALTKDAVLPDLGSTPTPSTTSEESSDKQSLALGTAAAVTVAAGVGVVFAMRRRRTEA